MSSFEYLADGHHVDDAGNLIACTYVDFREPAERSPITTLQKASSMAALDSRLQDGPHLETSCFLSRGEGAGRARRGTGLLGFVRWHERRGPGGPRPYRVDPRSPANSGELFRIAVEIGRIVAAAGHRDCTAGRRGPRVLYFDGLG